MPSHIGNEQYDVIVIGAGQAGLAAGYYLARRGAKFLILDAGPAVGHVWRSRWDSLRLFTPAEYDSLPGMPFPAPAGSYPTKDDVAAYLGAYAERFELPIRLNSPVIRLHRGSGEFVVTTGTEVLLARQVVIATGPFQRPRLPAVASQVPAATQQLHSSDYRRSEQIARGGRVLVVGAANSGFQIADELRRSHAVTLAAGSTPPRLPQGFLGRDVFHWLTATGVMTMSPDKLLARRLRARGDVVIGGSRRPLRRRGVEFRPRMTGVTAEGINFADGSSTEVDAIVWATGFRSDYSWLHVPGAITDGRPAQTQGVSDIPGLYFLGLPWQSCRGSALLGFVGRDAERLDARLAADIRWPAVIPATTKEHRHDPAYL